MSSPEAENTILRYDAPIEVNEYKVPIYKDLTLSPMRKKSDLSPIDAEKAEEVLNKMFPPIEYDQEGKKYTQLISTENASREELRMLDKHLDFKLKERQARATGICTVRQELHAQAFDEIIRQVAIDCPERALLLLRVRDQSKMTIAAYQTLYNSSVIFAIKKQVQADHGKADRERTIEELQRKKKILQNKKVDLENELEATKKNFEEMAMINQQKRERERKFLEDQSLSLEKFLKEAEEHAHS